MAKDKLEISDRDTGDFEPPFRVRDGAQVGAADRDQRVGHRRAGLGVHDHAGYDPSLLGGYRRRDGEDMDEEEPGHPALQGSQPAASPGRSGVLSVHSGHPVDSVHDPPKLNVGSPVTARKKRA
jgi:hypothetical protein